ncbi:VirB8/TrbF family protein [Shewanella colwelliana]|uniref:VirB8/TrbF family protein n=1 Tax=Shewanella colwelliana TaxID=23 RepID=UPI0037351BD2
MAEPLAQHLPENDTQKDELSLLYQRARMEWDERIGDTVSQLYTWRIIAIVSLIVALVAVMGITYIGSQSKIKPFVFAMGDNKIIALEAAKALPDSERKRLEQSQLGTFIEQIRTVFIDVNAQYFFMNKAYSHLRTSDAAYNQVTDYLKTYSPMKRAETETVSITINNVLPIGNSSVTQVDWTEMLTDRKGKLKNTLRFKAAIEIYYELPKTPAEFMSNPTGLWIKNINITEQY